MIKTNDKVQSSGWCLVNKLDGELANDKHGLVLRATRAGVKYWRDHFALTPGMWRIAKAQVCATVTK